MDVDRPLSDFIDDAIHAGNDLAVLGRVERTELVRDFAGVWVGLKGIDRIPQPAQGRLPSFLAEFFEDLAF